MNVHFSGKIYPISIGPHGYDIKCIVPTDRTKAYYQSNKQQKSLFWLFES